jgi:hypothetical protein
MRLALRVLSLEGLVSKRRDSRHPAGPSRDWIKVKIQRPQRMNRAKELEALGLIARDDYGLMLTETGRRLIATTN